MKTRSASGGISREPSPEIDGHLEALVLRYGPFIRNVVARLCPRNLGLDRSEIEQTALIRLWRALESEREIRNLESYMYRIVGRVTLDAIREVKARREDPVMTRQLETIMASLPMPGSGTEPPETLFFRKRLLERIRELIEGLPESRRRAVKLYLMGFTSAETGAFLGWSEPKARNLTYRGLEELRRVLRAAGLHHAE